MKTSQIANTVGSGVSAPRMTFKFEHSSKNIPHPSKQWKGGEDAYFAHDNIIVVADGVGGWAEYGVDASLYARRLVQLVYDNFYSDKQPFYIQQPTLLIQDSVNMNKELGSSTVCVIIIDPQTGVLRAAYLGDTIFSIYRNNQEILSAPELQHQFNRPYQVGYEGDEPSTAMRLNKQMSPGDVVIAATDGVWDNLHKKTIDYIISNAPNTETMAESIAMQSFRYSLLGDFNSPFYEKAVASGSPCSPGGKSDDITIVAARVIRTSAF